MNLKSGRKTLGGLTAGLAALATAGAANAAPVLDQEFDPIGVGGDITQFFGIGNDVAQTFTAGLTGQLTSFDVLIGRANADPTTIDDLIIDIRLTDGAGAPEEANTAPPVLASLTVDAASIPTALGFVSFDIAFANVIISAGDTLAIVMRSGSGDGLVPYFRRGAFPDFYTDGASFFRDSDNTSVWSELTAGADKEPADFGFRTFVEAADDIPAPATFVMMGFGLLGLRTLRKRRAD